MIRRCCRTIAHALSLSATSRSNFTDPSERLRPCVYESTVCDTVREGKAWPHPRNSNILPFQHLAQCPQACCSYNAATIRYICPSFPLCGAAIFSDTRVYTSHYAAMPAFSCEAGNRKKSRFMTAFSPIRDMFF